MEFRLLASPPIVDDRYCASGRSLYDSFRFSSVFVPPNLTFRAEDIRSRSIVVYAPLDVRVLVAYLPQPVLHPTATLKLCSDSGWHQQSVEQHGQFGPSVDSVHGDHARGVDNRDGFPHSRCEYN